MNIDELQGKHIEAIRRFVLSEVFLEIKDAFLAHTPEGSPDGNREESAAKNLGKLLGTRYAFNTLEKLARNQKSQPDTGKKKTKGEGPGDPDLES